MTGVSPSYQQDIVEPPEYSPQDRTECTPEQLREYQEYCQLLYEKNKMTERIARLKDHGVDRIGAMRTDRYFNTVWVFTKTYSFKGLLQVPLKSNEISNFKPLQYENLVFLSHTYSFWTTILHGIKFNHSEVRAQPDFIVWPRTKVLNLDLRCCIVQSIVELFIIVYRR